MSVSKGKDVSLMTAESPKKIASLSSKAAGLLQSFFKQSDKPPASRNTSVGKVGIRFAPALLCRG